MPPRKRIPVTEVGVQPVKKPRAVRKPAAARAAVTDDDAIDQAIADNERIIREREAKEKAAQDLTRQQIDQEQSEALEAEEEFTRSQERVRLAREVQAKRAAADAAQGEELAQPGVRRARPSYIAIMEDVAPWMFVPQSLMKPGVRAHGSSTMIGYAVAMKLSTLAPNTLLVCLGGEAPFSGELSWDDVGLTERGMFLSLGSGTVVSVRLDGHSAWDAPAEMRCLDDNQHVFVCTRPYIYLLARAERELFEPMLEANTKFAEDSATKPPRSATVDLTTGTAAASGLPDREFTIVNKESDKLNKRKLLVFEIMCGGKSQHFSRVIETATALGKPVYARIRYEVTQKSHREHEALATSRIEQLATCDFEGEKGSIFVDDFLPRSYGRAPSKADIDVAWLLMHGLMDSCFGSNGWWVRQANSFLLLMQSKETRVFAGVRTAYQLVMMKAAMQRLSMMVTSATFGDQPRLEQERRIGEVYRLEFTPNWFEEHALWVVDRFNVSGSTATSRTGQRGDNEDASASVKIAKKPPAAAQSKGKSLSRSSSPPTKFVAACLVNWLHAIDKRKNPVCNEASCKFTHGEPWQWKRSALNKTMSGFYTARTQPARKATKPAMEAFIDESFAQEIGIRADDKKRTENDLA